MTDAAAITDPTVTDLLNQAADALPSFAGRLSQPA